MSIANSTAAKTGRFLLRFGRKYLFPAPYKSQDIPFLSVEITNTCNSRCVFCPNRFMKRKKEHLSMERFKHVVDQFLAMGGRTMNFNCLIGEPFLDPHLLERIRYVKECAHSPSLTFFTTLQWLHRHNISEFVRSGVDGIFVSITLTGREKYRDFFGVDHYDQVLRNLENLVSERSTGGRGPSVSLSIKPTGERADEIARHPDFKRIDALLGGGATQALHEMGLGVHDFATAVELPSYLRKRPLYPRWRRPCRLLYDHLKIFSNGKIGLCVCSDYEANSALIVGHVDQDDLAAIWNGDKVRKIREEWHQRNNVPAICKSCTAYVY